MRFVLVTLCLCHLATAKQPVTSIKDAGPPVKVTAPAGTYVGRLLSAASGLKYNAFLGIPFAEPPVGELRFKKTVALGKLAGEYEAVDQKSFCLQMNFLPNTFGTGSEDCLYLNVFSPTHNAGGDLNKVFVFIHGGGNMNGMKDFYHPESLVAGHDIIVVTINYRLGLLGFLSSNTASARGNYGLWDQVEALRWVKENIRAFGGDPDDVTVGGESAGGFDTTALTMSAHARGMFTRAFPMSGALGVEHPMIIGDPVPVAELVARRDNCLSEDAPTPESDQEWSAVVECMKKLPADRFSSNEGLGEMPFIGIVLDGDFIPKPINELFADASYLESIGFHDRDYLVSVCYNEGDVFTAIQDVMKANMTPEQLDSIPPNAMWHGFIGHILFAQFGSLSPETIAYIAEWYEENFEINPLADFASDAIFHVPTNEYINAVAGGWAQDASRIHFLRFVNFPDFMAGPYKGTVHVVDLLYLFDAEVEDLNQIIDYKIDGSKWSQTDEELKNKYQTLVSSFVKTGHTSLDWPAYTPEGGHYLEFSGSPRVRQHLKTDRSELFSHQIPAWIKEFPHTAPDAGSKHVADEL